MSDKIKILVCTHKQSELPQDDIYLPIQVGKTISDIDLGIQGDDTGDAISEKNKSFCELTALYWAWKNIKKIYPEIEYIGLCHYRRYLALDKKITGWDGIQVIKLPVMKNYANLILHILKNNQIILTKKKIYPYRLSIGYALSHYSDDYRMLKQIVHELSPEYDRSFIRIFEHNNQLAPYNIFISKYDFFTAYCEWLFTILFEAERRIITAHYSEFQKRVFGYLK